MKLENMVRKATFVGLIGLLPMSAFSNTEVYVPLGSGNAVAVIEAGKSQVVAEIPGINGSHGLAVSKDGGFIVAGSLIERPKGVAPTAKPAGISEEDHAVHHGGGTQAKTEHTQTGGNVGTAYLIDAKARKLLRQIDVPGAVHHALITQDGRYAVLTHPGRGSVSIVDIHGHSVFKEVKTGPATNYAVSKRDGSRIYVSNSGNDTVSEIDTSTWSVVRNLSAGKTPEHIVLSPDENNLYVVNPAGGTVSNIDLKAGKIASSFNVGRNPHGVDLSDDGRLLFASSKQDNQVSVFNLKSGEKHQIDLSPAPYHVTTVTGTGKVYVSSRQEPKIWVLDQKTLAVVDEIKIRGEGHEMGVFAR